MKKILFAFLLCLGTTVVAQQEKGTFQFTSETIDYGMIKQNSNGERYFSFTNTGKAPIVIKKVKGSCGCTVATKPEKPILPGETAKIKVAYATNRLGKFSKTVTIISDASEERKVVRIKGDILNSEDYAVASN